ncbi:hypothetical protein CFB84_42485 [Burkholderia aenigmatica]|uniref:Uncharacterized protein n=1 Tax=Burkholderia aenigmatica TaxID=2015348 RepID=A0A228HLP6_9BURK|nr:hypothetical protein CFB84_42485 [Burkholderia aenigmatica]
MAEYGRAWPNVLAVPLKATMAARRIIHRPFTMNHEIQSHEVVILSRKMTRVPPMLIEKRRLGKRFDHFPMFIQTLADAARKVQLCSQVFVPNQP